MKKIWWLYLPLTAMAAQIVLETTLEWHILARLHSENGPHELVQFLLISLSVAAGLWLAVAAARSRRTGLAIWGGLAAVCSFYVAGEEISWGQHFMDWTTPEFWAAVNDQNETNFHNTSSWFDQKPRLLLEIGVACGGLLIPLLLRYRPSLVPARFAVIYPPARLAVIAALAIGSKIAHKIASGFDVVLFERASEVEELYLYYFILLYLLILVTRAREPR